LKQHIILGADRRDAEHHKELWLAQHPEVRIIKVHRPKREQGLLARFGGRRVPRVSIAVDYEEPAVGMIDESARPPSPPSRRE
jgi:hypothetical protein